MSYIPQNIFLPATPDAPNAKAMALPITQISGNRLKGLRILSVDDDPFSLELIEVILEPYDVQITSCQSAAEALKLLLENPPDILIADIAMPEEDGISFIKRVRSLQAFHYNKVPALAISGYTPPQIRTEALTAGFHAYMTKPIEPKELVFTLDSFAQKFINPIL